MAEAYVSGPTKGNWKESALAAGYSSIPNRLSGWGLQIARLVEELGGEILPEEEETPELDPELEELENLLAEALTANEAGDESAIEQVETLARRYRTLGIAGKIDMPAARARLISDIIKEAEARRRAESSNPDEEPNVVILPALDSDDQGRIIIPPHIREIFEVPDDLKVEPSKPEPTILDVDLHGGPHVVHGEEMFPDGDPLGSE